MKKAHLYPGKTVNFILGSKVVSTLFETHIAELAAVNTLWTPDFAREVKEEVDDLAGKYLGNNVRDKLFSITNSLIITIGNVKADLVTVRKNIEVDFKGTPDYDIILAELGLNVKSVYNLTQPQLINQLSKFKKTLTPDYLIKITKGGMPPALPQRLAASLDTLIKLNNDQEEIKNTQKEATGKMLDDLNALHLKIMKICKLASDFYRKNAEKKSLFTFSRILKNFGDNRPATDKIINQPAA